MKKIENVFFYSRLKGYLSKNLDGSMIGGVTYTCHFPEVEDIVDYHNVIKVTSQKGKGKPKPVCDVLISENHGFCLLHKSKNKTMDVYTYDDLVPSIVKFTGTK